VVDLASVAHPLQTRAVPAWRDAVGGMRLECIEKRLATTALTRGQFLRFATDRSRGTIFVPATGSDPAMRAVIQRGLLAIYRTRLTAGLVSTGFGRALFEMVYEAYKTLFEAREANALRRFVTPGTTVVDVGANIGFFTLRFAQWVTDGGRVIAIEPEMQNAVRLSQRLARRGLTSRVDLVQAVAAERSGELRLQINPHHPGDHRISEVGVPVCAVRLDDMLRERGWPEVSVIKIDVQGAEDRVLEGAAATLDRLRPALYVEINANHAGHMDGTARRVCDRLAALGYSRHALGRTGPSAPLLDADIERRLARTGYTDLLFLPADEPDARSNPDPEAACSWKREPSLLQG
jgi:FkbM family methyltransferase